MARAIQRGRSAGGSSSGRKKPPPPKQLGDPPPSSSDDELEFKGSQEENNNDGQIKDVAKTDDDEDDEGKPPATNSLGREGRSAIKVPIAPRPPRRRKKATQQHRNANHSKKDEEDQDQAEAEAEARDSFDSADDGADSPVPSDPNDSGSDFDPDEDDDQEEDDELNESSSDGWAPERAGRRSKVKSRGRGRGGGKKKRAAPTRLASRRTTPRTSRRRMIVESSSSNEHDEEEEDNFDNNSSDDADKDEDFGSLSRRTPRRSCAKATNAKLASATKVIELGSDQDVADAESEDYPLISSSRKKKRRRGGSKGRPQRRKELDSDEESYHESNSDGANDEEDDDEASSSDDNGVYEDDEEVIRSGRSRRGGRSISKPVKGRKSVDNDMDIFTADTSDSDVSDGGEQRRKFSPKPPLRTKPLRRRAIDDDDSEEEASFGGDSDDSNFGGGRKNSHPTPRAPQCPSKTDEITMEPLPRLHVCCIAPDGEGRHCFALDTLYRIALMDPRRHQTDSNKIAFKQPPHFRSVMEDELVDQIASRFGRLALNIEDSDVYKKSIVGQNRTVHLDFHRDMSIDASQDFQDRFNEYLSSQMGSGDLYCCPVCYVEAHKRLVSGTETDDDSDAGANGARACSGQASVELDDFQHDPMTVLGGLDGEDFGIASNFCFRRVSQVKRHIREDHHCVTTGVEGNDLYQRFQIRAADGLLQRWLNKHDKKTFHLAIRSAGAMNSYWYHGHNASFIYLRDRVEAVQTIRESPGDEDNGLDEAHMHDSAEYFDLFERRGRRIWAQLSAPYEKEDPSAINDFIADDDEEEEVDDGPAPFAGDIFEDEKSPEQQIIESMKKRRRRQGLASDSSSDDYGDEESSEGDLEIVGEGRRYYSEEEEEDDWTKKKSLRENLKKRRSDAVAAKRSQLTGDSDTSNSDNAGDTPRQKKNQSDSYIKVAKTPVANAGAAKSATSSLKKRRILESSDEED